MTGAPGYPDGAEANTGYTDRPLGHPKIANRECGPSRPATGSGRLIPLSANEIRRLLPFPVFAPIARVEQVLAWPH